VHGRFPYAGPMPRRATSDGRHPKTFTICAIEEPVGLSWEADIRPSAPARPEVIQTV
jgi:hypothetical protein